MARANSSSSVPDILIAVDAAEDDDDTSAFDDAWGEIMDDNDGDQATEDGASFFDALSAENTSTTATANGKSTSTKPAASPTPFDDGGEPDFAGWLNAQKASKSKPPLPKGLGKSVKSPTITKAGGAGNVNRKAIPARPAEVKKSVTSPPPVTTPIDTKPMEEDDGDGGDWGAWD